MPILLLDFLPKQPKKVLPIRVSEKDGLSRMAAGRDVIKGAGEFQAEWAEDRVAVQSQELTPSA
jgi:hypothetical protein